MKEVVRTKCFGTTALAACVRELTGTPCCTGTVLKAVYDGILIEGRDFVRGGGGHRTWFERAARTLIDHRAVHGSFTRNVRKAGGVGRR